MVKAAPVAGIYAGTVHPGKYLVMVSGDTASVEVALDRARSDADAEVFLPDVHSSIPDAMTRGQRAAPGGESLGVCETTTVAAVISAADAGVKAAHVEASAVRIADGLGGKGYVLFVGTLADVEAALEAAEAAVEPSHIVGVSLIPQLAAEVAQNMESDLRFLKRISRPSGKR